MDMTKLLAGGAVFGVLTTFWGTIKTVAWRICNLLIQDVTISSEKLADAVVGYLISHPEYTLSYMRDKVYSGTTEHIRSTEKSGVIPYELLGGQPLIFRKGWRILYYKANNVAASEQLNETIWASNAASINNRRRFFVKYIPEISKEDSNRTFTSTPYWPHLRHYRLLGRAPSDLGIGINDNESRLDRLFFPDEVKSLIEDIKHWKDSRGFYKKMGVPWKRGWLIHGIGGTGKTALASAFAHDLDMPIFVYNLSEMNSLELMQQWTEMLSHTPCIPLIEDIDNVFHGRENIVGERGLSGMFARIGSGKKDEEPATADFHRRFGSVVNYDVFLNCLDGVNRCDGLFTIITTNKLEHIDEALGKPERREDGKVDFISTRPGRIDRAIELGYMETYVKEKMAEHFLADSPLALADLIKDINDNPAKETAAQFQERCSQIALRELRSNKCMTIDQ